METGKALRLRRIFSRDKTVNPDFRQYEVLFSENCMSCVI